MKVMIMKMKKMKKVMKKWQCESSNEGNERKQ